LYSLCALVFAITQDLDGVVGVFSGPQLPEKVETDTGLLKISFATDESIEGSGFTATYTAATSPVLQLPDCAIGKHVLQAVLRTRQYGGEASWVLFQKAPVANGEATFIAAGEEKRTLSCALGTNAQTLSARSNPYGGCYRHMPYQMESTGCAVAWSLH
jgi:hypothetical protein